WAQVLSYHIFGENDFAARLPSAIAAALTSLVIFGWGRQMGAEKVGGWAAIIFTLSLQTFVHAKAAVADMWLALFVTIAHWAGYELIQCRTPNSDESQAGARGSTPNSEKLNQPSTIKHQTSIWAIFYLSLALGFLAKGPIAWAPLLTVAGVIIYTRDWQ